MSQDDQIDEVALNVLLAEGVDFPTALEASRIPADPDAAPEPPPATFRAPASRAIEAVVLAVVAIVLMMIWIFL